jgi:hypothetical protein
MRKVEQQMIRAINRNENWSQGNTMVTYLREDGTSRVYLHGHLIATVDDFGIARPIIPTLVAWPTRTTMSRLRALDINVYQRNGDIYIDGEKVA